MRNFFRWILPLLLLASLQTSAYGAYDEAIWTVTRTNGVTYGQGAINGGSDLFDLKLDIYEPEGNPDQNKPVMILVHGGGFTGGNRGGMSWLGNAFAQRGYLAVSISYRLNGQNPPADPDYIFFDPPRSNAVHASAVDAKAAIRWVRKNADELGINTERIFIGGTSAGGFISMHAGITDDEDYFTDLPGQTPLAINNPDESAEVHGILNFCGGALPVGFDSDDPPVFMIHTVGDTVVPVGLADLVEDELVANDIPYEYYRLANGGHCGFFSQTIDGLGFVDLVVRFMNRQIWEAEPDPRMIPATKFQLKDDNRTPTNTNRRKLNFLSRTSPRNNVPPVAPAALSGGDPTQNGATLEVYRPDGDPTEHFVIELPAAGWTALGPDAVRGYRYKAPAGTNAADVRIRLKNGLLKIVGKGAAMPSLANAPLGAVAVRFLLGSEIHYCAATVAGREDSTRQYRAEPQTIVTSGCPDRPYGSASEAFLDEITSLID